MRLLLAEDEKELAKALAVILKHNNYSVDTVHDGEDALCYLQNGDNDAQARRSFGSQKDQRGG